MINMKEQIKFALSNCQDKTSFGEKIYSLGEHYLSSGELDSDELIWEVAREIWKEKRYEDSFEGEVYKVFERYLGI